MDVYVYDKNLNLVGLVDSYKSLIWANRYDEQGDCELYLQASETNLNLLRYGYYLKRPDDDMICQIRKIEITTDVENGNYLTVTGVDSKALLDQRIVWNMMNCTGNVEDFIREMVNDSCIDPVNPARKFKKANGTPLMQLGDSYGLTEITTEQVSYKNVGEKIRDYCSTYKWGYRMILQNSLLTFELYRGTDRTSQVIFSDQYENLASSKYTDDKMNLGNVALIAGAGEGSERTRTEYGSESSTDRFEVYVDARDIAQEITFGELTAVYPPLSEGGEGVIIGNEYRMNIIYIQIVDAQHLIWLQANYPTGTVVELGGHEYYRLNQVAIAELSSSSPSDDDPVLLKDLIYSVYLINRGSESLSEFGEIVTFEGSVIPDVTFTYKKDYFLGDIVTVENEFSITAQSRIVEIIEVMDDNGYSVQPKFKEV